MRSDVTGIRDFSPLHKCTVAIRILTYKLPIDNIDEYVRIVECIAVQCLEVFIKNVNEIFRNEYLTRPNNNDINHLLQIGETCEFLGIKTSYPIAQRLFAMRRYGGGDVVRSLTLAYAKRLFPDSNP